MELNSATAHPSDAPQLTAVHDDTAARARARTSLAAGESCHVVYASVGGHAISGLIDQHGRYIRNSWDVSDPFKAAHRHATDPEGRLLLWAVLAVTPDAYEARRGFDEMPPDVIMAAARERGLDYADPLLWVSQATTYDRRPPELMPAWWRAKLAEAGANDPTRGSDR